MHSVLSILKNSPEGISSVDISNQLKTGGISVSERTVRHYISKLHKIGYIEGKGKKGRQVTDKGLKEIQNSPVIEKVGFIINRIDNMSFQTDFDIETLTGKIIINVSLIDEKDFHLCLGILEKTLVSPYSMSRRVIAVGSGGKIADFFIPEGYIGVGTVCSITMNGIFLKAGIPVISRFGGVVEIVDSKPKRFVSLISYSGSSLDPLDIFIKSRMTDVNSVLCTGNGKILGSFREIPAACLNTAKKLHGKMIQKGFGGVIIFGLPNQPLLDIPVGIDRVGMVVLGGLNTIAALEETGVSTKNHALATFIDYKQLDEISRFTELCTVAN